MVAPWWPWSIRDAPEKTSQMPRHGPDLLGQEVHEMPENGPSMRLRKCFLQHEEHFAGDFPAGAVKPHQPPPAQQCAASSRGHLTDRFRIPSIGSLSGVTVIGIHDGT